jgi:hypothetical protein
MRGSGPLDTLRGRLRGTPLHYAWRFATFGIGGWRIRHDLDSVRTYCLFLGHARSGHSIIGALLDAHPEVTISDELDALVYLRLGFRRSQLLYGSYAISAHQARRERRKAGRAGRVYSYFVPGQWQGRYRRLTVVGDTQAGWTTRRLAADPRLLGLLTRRLAPTVPRFIHVVRNPFDNIATMMLRGQRTFDDAAAQYFANCDRLSALAPLIGDQHLLRLRHERLLGEPRHTLAEACRFIGVEPDPNYLEACASILFATPSRSREQVSWTNEQRGLVERRMAQFDFLSGYEFAT